MQLFSMINTQNPDVSLYYTPPFYPVATITTQFGVKPVQLFRSRALKSLLNTEPWNWVQKAA